MTFSNPTIFLIRLNEGFATLFEFQIPGMLYPQWNTRHFFNIRKVHNAFRYDGAVDRRAMTFDVNTLAEISTSFDTIGYDKCNLLLVVEIENNFIVSSWKCSPHVPTYRWRGYLQSCIDTLLGNEVRKFNYFVGNTF